MSRINLGRVVIGGLLAGLIVDISESILNGIVLAQDLGAAMQALNRPPIDTQMIIWFVLLGFGLGIAAVWLYAAIRPRFGPGVTTAVISGLAVWFFAYLYAGITIGIMNLFPARVMVVSTLWGLPEIVIASIAGAWLYQE